MNARPALESVTELIVRTYAPDAVIAFGSAVDGRAGPTSDLDLVVVGPFRQARSLRGRELASLFDAYAAPVDVQFYTPEEFEREASAGSSFAAMVDRYGIRLYRRAS